MIFVESDRQSILIHVSNEFNILGMFKDIARNSNETKSVELISEARLALKHLQDHLQEDRPQFVDESDLKKEFHENV